MCAQSITGDRQDKYFVYCWATLRSLLFSACSLCLFSLLGWLRSLLFLCCRAGFFSSGAHCHWWVPCRVCWRQSGSSCYYHHYTISIIILLAGWLARCEASSAMFNYVDSIAVRYGSHIAVHIVVGTLLISWLTGFWATISPRQRLSHGAMPKMTSRAARCLTSRTNTNPSEASISINICSNLCPSLCTTEKCCCKTNKRTNTVNRWRASLENSSRSTCGEKWRKSGHLVVFFQPD